MQNSDNTLNLKQALLELLKVVKKNHYTKDENDSKLSLKVDDIIYQVDKNNLESEIKNLELSDEQIIGLINEIKALIPNQATSENQLADKDFVNSSISTATATFRGTYTNKNNFPNNVDANDYVFYDTTDELGNRKFDKYKYSNGEWVYEYTLNNSSFTEEQWKAINSSATKDLIDKILINEENINNLNNNKLEKETFNSFKLENNELLDTKVDKTTFDIFKNDNELSLNQKTNNVDFDNFKNETNNILETKVDKIEGKGLSTIDFTDTNYVHTDNNYTTLEKEKLNGIEENAQVNTITGVKGDNEENYRVGNVSISKENIGLENVDNTSDLEKPISTAVQNALNNKVDKVEGKSLIDVSEILRLEGISTGANKVEQSFTNGNVKIDGIETIVYTLPDNIATKDYVNTNGGKIDVIEVNNIEQEIIDKKVNISVPTKTSDLNNDSGFGTYSKPSLGIPKSDLSSEVQSSLEKADTALQTHQDISGKANVSESAYSLDLTIDSSTYVITASLKNKSGVELSNKKIDLPLESVVVNGSYDSANKQVVLTLQSGSTIQFSVVDLVSGLQSEITSTNKLNVNLISGLSAVATSGSYNDLKDKPTIPTVNYPVRSVNGKTGAVVLSASDVGARPSSWTPSKSDIGLGNVGNFKAVSTVASQGLTSTEQSNARANIGAGTSSFSGSYNDLSNKPTIPTVNNATLTIQKNGTTITTFGANQSTNTTANITVPTKVSELTNDSGYLTSHQDISGLQPKITSTNKLSSSLVSDLADVAITGNYNDLSNTPTVATADVSGLMISSDKVKLDGIELGATNVTESTVSGWGFTKVTKSTVTGWGFRNSDATTSASGLMSASDKSKLDGIATRATNVTLQTVIGWGFRNSDATTSASGLMSASDKSKLDGIKYTQLYLGKLLGGSSATLSQNPSGNFDFMLVWVTFAEATRSVFVIPSGYNTFGGTTDSEDQSGIYSWYAYKDGTTFTLSTMGYYAGSMAYNARNSNSSYYIDYIVGVKLS